MAKRRVELGRCWCCARSLPTTTKVTVCVHRRTGERRRLALCLHCLSRPAATSRLQWRPASEVER